MLSDIEIAQNAKMKHIRDVAASIGIAEDDLEFYGKYKAKIASELCKPTCRPFSTLYLMALYSSSLFRTVSMATFRTILPL